MVLLAVLAVGGGIGAHAVVGKGPEEGLALAGGSRVVVQAGDTVWSLAAEVVGEEEDVRVVVDAIESLNDLEDAVVVPGQVLEMP